MKKYIVAGVLVLSAFFASYTLAVASQSDDRLPDSSEATQAAYQDQGSASASAAGDACCGGGGARVEGATSVEGGVQTLAIDTSTGSFNPNVVKAKAGIPIELTFSQAPGGCMSGVIFPDFDIDEDLTAGAKTVKLPALDPGEYTFFCQMQMVTGTLVVE